MSGFELGHVTRLDIIQNARRKRGLPDHMLEERIEALIKEFGEDGGVGKRPEDVRWLQAKLLWSKHHGYFEGKCVFQKFEEYLATIPPLDASLLQRSRTAGSHLVLFEPRLDLESLTTAVCGRLGMVGNKSVRFRRSMNAAPEYSTPRWLAFRLREFREGISLRDWMETEKPTFPLVTAHMGLWLFAHHPFVLGDPLVLPGSVMERPTGSYVAMLARDAVGVTLGAVKHNRKLQCSIVEFLGKNQ